MRDSGTWQLGRRPALDGLRGVAILMVMAGHIWPTHSQIAVAGVSVFFALSGFLITSLLLEEKAANGRANLGAFYTRRAARLLPAAYTFLAVFVALGLVRPSESLPVILYIQNYAAMVTGPGSYVLHFWSLSVEEQFYFIWPVVLLLLVKAGRRVLLLAILAGIAASTVDARLLVSHGASAYRIVYGLDTSAAGLLLGCALAVYLGGGPKRQSRPTVGVVAMASVGSVTFMHTYWSLQLVPLLTVVAIYALVAGDAPGLTPRWLALVGKRSYALYIWSTPLAFGAMLTPLRGHMSDWIAVPLYLAVSWLIATTSWYLVERPCMRLAHVQHGQLRESSARVEDVPAVS